MPGNNRIEKARAALDRAERIAKRSVAVSELVSMPSTVSAERRQQLERHIERLSEGS